MAKPPKGKKQLPPPAPRESPAAEMLTIAWALSVTTVLVCDVGAALTRLYAMQTPQPGKIGIFSGLLLFAAAVVGVISLALLPFVYRLRTDPPPRGFVVFAIIISAAPLGYLVVQALR